MSPAVTPAVSPIKSALGRVIRTLLTTAVVIGVAAFALYKTRLHIPLVDNAKFYARLDSVAERASEVKGRVAARYEAAFGKHVEEVHHEPHKILVTSPVAKQITITQEYVCRINSRRHISVRAFEDGYLEAITVKEGQAVKAGDLLFKIVPVLYKARLAAEVAERDLAELELNNTRKMASRNAVSENEVKLFAARLAKAQAKVDLAQAELDFATVHAPFDGIIDRLHEMQGSLVKEGDMLTTLSDNTVMWAYFNVPEKRYLEYMAEVGQNKQSPDIDLMLANHSKFPEIGKIGAIEANFDPETGNIAFRADFPNPKGLLRHGQTGTVLINRLLDNAIIIPQRATIEDLAKRYVYVVDKDDVVHRREIGIQNELEDIYVINKGVAVGEKIIFEGVRQVHDGEKVEFEERNPEQVLAYLKNKAE